MMIVKMFFTVSLSFSGLAGATQANVRPGKQRQPTNGEPANNGSEGECEYGLNAEHGSQAEYGSEHEYGLEHEYGSQGERGLEGEYQVEPAAKLIAF